MSSVGLGAIFSDCFGLILGFVFCGFFPQYGRPLVILQWRCVCPAHAEVQISDNKQCASLRISSLLLLPLGSECQGCGFRQDF